MALRLVQRLQRQLFQPETFVWLVTTTTFVTFLTTIALDQWFVLTNDNNNNNEKTYIGIFYTYQATDNTIIPAKIMGSNRYVQIYLQKDPYRTPVWIHMSRCFVVCGILTNGYGVIVSTAVMLLDYNHVKAPMASNIAVGMFMMVSLCYFLPVGKSELPSGYKWGYSYIFHWMATVLTIGVSGTWVYRRRRMEIERYNRIRFRNAMMTSIVGAIGNIGNV